METSDRISRISVPLEGTVSRVRNYSVLTVKPERIVEACRLVVGDREFYHLTTITGLDEGQVITMVYTFWRGKEYINLKTSVPKTDPKLQSVVEALPAAVLYEAEIMEMFGVTFVGNPMAGKRFLLPDKYPPDAPPLMRKEAKPAQIRKMMGLA